jgi:uncharacterized membrane protein YoaK (UPF0700 family)
MTSSCQSQLSVLFSSSRSRITPVPSKDALWPSSLPFILSLAAGSLDVTGFLGLGGLFTAHITGNLVVLAARLAVHEPSSLSHVISVPVFIMILILTRLFVAGLDRIAVRSLLPLLVLQFVFLLVALGVSLAAGRQADPYGPELTLVGMLAVSGMAVQNALVRVSLAGAPSTAVMTTNLSVFTMDVGEIWFGRSQVGRAKARVRVGRTWPAIAGFILGCIFGAVCERAFGLVALAVPTLISLSAIGFGLSGMDQRSNRGGSWPALNSSAADKRDAAL